MNESLKRLVHGYLCDRLPTQAAFGYLEPAMTTATILVVGSYSFGMNRPGSDLDLELILSDQVFAELLTRAGGPGEIWVHDESHDPLVDIKVRPEDWLRRRLGGGDPEALWVYRQAQIIQDPEDILPGLLVQAGERFGDRLAVIMLDRYRDLRSAVTLGQCREKISRHVMLGKAVESALVLPLLARGEPHPYPKWQSWWLLRRHDQGRSIACMCSRLVSDEEGRSHHHRQLRAMIDGILTVEGYGGSLVKDFWRRL